MMFAAFAFGQAGTPSVVANAQNVRAEGKNELVGDLVITVRNASGVSTVAAGTNTWLTVTLSGGTITSASGKYQSATAASEVVAVVSGAGAGAPAAVVAVGNGTSGLVGTNTVTFQNLSTPALSISGGATDTYSITITNIRIDASALYAGSPLGVTATVNIFNGAGLPVVTNGSLTPATVAIIQPGLSGVATSGAITYNACAAVPTAAYAAGTGAFNVIFVENFATAFKVQGTNAGSTLGNWQAGSGNTENGYNLANGGGSVTNLVLSGTRLTVTISNIPTGMSVYMPLTWANGAATGVVSLTTSATAAFSAPTAATTTGTGNPLTNLTGANAVAALTVTSGTATAVYEVTTANAAAAETYTIPVYVTAAANVVSSASATLGANVSFSATGAAPNFVVGASTPSTAKNGAVLNLCSTTILFPYVLHGNGFDTGLAIANSSNDNLKAGGGTSVTNQSGVCNLTFFGTNAPATQPVVTAVVNAGTTYSNTISSLAPNFNGYLIAQCNFMYAHAFAYVTYNLTGNNGVSMGYLGLAVGTPRATNSVGAISSANPENLNN